MPLREKKPAEQEAACPEPGPMPRPGAQPRCPTPRPTSCQAPDQCHPGAVRPQPPLRPHRRARRKVGHTKTGRSFVIQKHDASRLHYMTSASSTMLLRPFKSWAVPKGPSLDPSQKPSPYEVENHPVAYGSFGRHPSSKASTAAAPSSSGIVAHGSPSATPTKASAPASSSSNSTAKNSAAAGPSSACTAAPATMSKKNWLLIKERTKRPSPYPKVMSAPMNPGASPAAATSPISPPRQAVSGTASPAPPEETPHLSFAVPPASEPGVRRNHCPRTIALRRPQRISPQAPPRADNPQSGPPCPACQEEALCPSRLHPAARHPRRRTPRRRQLAPRNQVRRLPRPLPYRQWGCGSGGVKLPPTRQRLDAPLQRPSPPPRKSVR